jgi:hypothetical protein
VFGPPIKPPPLSAASEAAYEQLTSELKSRVVAMWEELRKNESHNNESKREESRGAESATNSAQPETH